MKEIPLTQGKIALVDDEDYERVNQYKWFAHKDRNTYYAGRNVKLDNGKFKYQAMHRFIMNAPNDVQIDHKKHPGTDNRKANLRIATHQQNNCNRQKHFIHNGKPTLSKYKGVSYDKYMNKWVAQIRFNKKRIFLGYFNINNEIEAAKTYDKKAIELFGEFAKLNFPI